MIEVRNSVCNIKCTKLNFIVPLLGRMNTYAKYCGGLQTGSVVRSVAIECKHGDAFDSIFQEIARYLSQTNRK